MTSISRSFAVTVADKASGVVMSVVTMAVISRILAPAEVGLYMIGMSLVILIEAFRDFGVAACLIQARELTAPLYRTAVTVMAGLSLVLGAAICAASGAIAEFYGSPDLQRMILIASLAFLAAPVANPLLALLRRRMAFGRVAIIGMAAGLTNAVASIVLALAGFGAVGLVWASVLAAFVTAAGAVIARPEAPAYRPSLRAWRAVVPFGAWSSVITLLGMLFEALPRLILGRMLGFDAAGLYARAVALNQMPERLFLSAVQPVVLPLMAERLRNGENVAAPYLTGIAFITALQWPVLLLIALLAHPIVTVLLGGQWTEVVPLLQIVALSSVCLFPQYLAFPVLVAAGRVRQMAAASLISLPICTAVLFAATSWGLRGVALSLFVTGPLQATVLLVFTRRAVHFGWGALAATLGRSAVVALSAAAPATVVLVIFEGGLAAGPLVAALAGAAGVVGWRLGLRIAGHPVDARVTAALARMPRGRFGMT